MLSRVCVFCGSSKGARRSYTEAAERLGQALAGRRIGLVYGGGNVGLMGVLADTVIKRGGETIGVIPRHLVDRELAHRGVSDLRVVDSMHERKALMADLADAFIALPGGYGTLEEFLEAITWSQLGLHAKPCALLNVEGYYDGLLEFFAHAAREGFVRPGYEHIVIVDDEEERLLQRLAEYRPPEPDRLVDGGAR
jgi:uncharacterized protein (TIGR00730 family)